jgi:hypothetical protein
MAWQLVNNSLLTVLYKPQCYLQACLQHLVGILAANASYFYVLIASFEWFCAKELFD